jgi:sugar phosphate isomerase/epimerase
MNQITRRRFLALAAAATGESAIWSGDAFAFPMGLPPGIQLYAVREPLAADTPGTLKSLHDIGFREVEAAGFGKYSAAEFGKLIADAGLRCSSAHLPFNTATDLGPLFSDAHALGALYATSSILRTLVPAGSAPPKSIDDLRPLEPLGPEGFKKTAARMNELGQAAKSAGLQYAYHNHNFEFERMPDGLYGYDLLLRETDHDLVKFEIDCGWMMIAGAKPQDFFKGYPGRFRMLHVKDFKPQEVPSTQLIGPGHPLGVELGHGFIDYKPVFEAGRAAGIKHAYAEQEAPYSRPQLESAKVSYDFLHSFA